MGFSLEAMVAIPCCLTILANLTGLAGPLAVSVRTTGSIAAYAAMRKEDSGYTCRHYTAEGAGSAIPAVETCPQKLVEALSLAKDLAGYIRPGGHGAAPP
ncbi:MAG TPA: hypothetical protein PK646_06550 [Bacillota bacterium]|jgi:hypothetical protein|nr:hypothetical protein [Fastidiosipila sp.]HPX93862.1 hypothetical protein [Bacillota bacterium]HQB81727.1 hypothetical protein [Bacillota bacterium]